MASVSVYLNFERNTEEAFLFYQSVFGGEFVGGISRMGEMGKGTTSQDRSADARGGVAENRESDLSVTRPLSEGQPAVAEEDKNLVMHVCLPILGGFQLMGTDAPKSMGFDVSFGNNVYINLLPDSRKETNRIFEALSAGGIVEMPLQEMFWGDYFGSFTDKFGVRWMLACASKE